MSADAPLRLQGEGLHRREDAWCLAAQEGTALPLQLMGNFYSEEGDGGATTRGVTLAALDVPQASLGGGLLFEEEVGMTRSVILAKKTPIPDVKGVYDRPCYEVYLDGEEESVLPPPAPWGINARPGDEEELVPPPPPFWVLGDLLRDDEQGITGAQDVRVPSEEFAAGDAPPELPKAIFFELLPTHLRLASDSSAHRLGNDLVDFLRIGLKAPHVKARPGKYTAKAEVTRGDGRCTVKLRVYRAEGGVLAVEAQRRQGDMVFFMNVYRALVRFLQARHELLGTFGGA